MTHPFRTPIAAELIPAFTTDPKDLAEVARLLSQFGLPRAGLEAVDECILLRRKGKILAAVALEIHGQSGLLRSLVVHPSLQGKGWGSILVNALIEYAHRQGITRLYLLTETAGDFFPRFGFTVIDRAEVDPVIQKTVEFTSACPASATAMMLDLVKMAKQR